MYKENQTSGSHATDYYIVYTVSQKTVQNCFCQNFVKFSPVLIIFGKKMEKRLILWKNCTVFFRDTV